MSHYHFLGADAEDDDEKPTGAPPLREIREYDDGGPVVRVGVEEFEEMLNNAGPGMDLSIDLAQMTDELRTHLVRKGLLPITAAPGGMQDAANAGPRPAKHVVDEINRRWDKFVKDMGPDMPTPRQIAGHPSFAESVMKMIKDHQSGDMPPASTGNPKDAMGDKKPDVSLVPPAAILYTAHGFRDGAQKYGPYNWRENPVRMRVYLAAAMRHIMQVLDGEDVDPTSGVPHIGHALASLAIIADAAHTGNLLDDRPNPGPAGDMIRDFNDHGSYV